MAENIEDLKDNLTKKIAFVGLDNSGKTSIVLSLKGINLMSLSTSNPTRGIETSNLTLNDEKFNIWDFGGQEQYRAKYLQEFKENFKGTEKVIYVIDLQDPERYHLAVKYLKNIFNKIGKDLNKIKFSLFLHKNDPNLKEVKPEITDTIVDDLILKIKEILPPKFWDEIYKTTIYTVFERTNI
ncbi:MAG: ADP-ribosylation factor-like protein [Candidatus Hodarchaeota archaeon]